MVGTAIDSAALARDPVLARYIAACEFRRPIDWPKISSALKTWLRKIDLGGECRLILVESAAQACEATRMACFAQMRGHAWNIVATRAASECWGPSAEAYTAWLTEGPDDVVERHRAIARAWATSGNFAARAAWNAWTERAIQEGWLRRSEMELRAHALWEVRFFATAAVCASLRGDQQTLQKWLPLLEALEAGCFCLWFGPEVIWAAPIPSKIVLGNPWFRLHCGNGPAFTWLNDICDYYWRGVRVPQYVVEAPHQISISTIDMERNVEVRRVMIERYRFGETVSGAGAYVRDAGARSLDHDERYGTLWRRDLQIDEPIVMLEVVNATPEKDGQFKRYWLRVPPTMTRAREAAAWTFGLATDDYAPAIES
jgi:hypothetical protein